MERELVIFYMLYVRLLVYVINLTYEVHCMTAVFLHSDVGAEGECVREQTQTTDVSH